MILRHEVGKQVICGQPLRHYVVTLDVTKLGEA